MRLVPEISPPQIKTLEERIVDDAKDKAEEAKTEENTGEAKTLKQFLYKTIKL